MNDSRRQKHVSILNCSGKYFKSECSTKCVQKNQNSFVLQNVSYILYNFIYLYRVHSINMAEKNDELIFFFCFKILYYYNRPNLANYLS